MFFLLFSFALSFILVLQSYIQLQYIYYYNNYSIFQEKIIYNFYIFNIVIIKHLHYFLCRMYVILFRGSGCRLRHAHMVYTNHMLISIS